MIDYAAVCLARDREWILSKWEQAMRGQSLVPSLIAVGIHPYWDALFDKPYDSLVEYYDLHEDPHGTIAWKRSVTPALDSSVKMANLRNSLVGRVFSTADVDAVLSCDSDIILAPDGAEKMLSVDADLVCAPVMNSPMANDVFLYRDNDGKHYGRLPKELLYDDERVAKVASGGAVLLIRRNAWDVGLRYEAHPQSEQQGMAECAHRLRLRYKCHLGVRTVHHMSKENAYDSHS